MARIRYLKPEFFTDEELAELPFKTRLFYSGLWTLADKEGRLEYRPKYLKAMIFPYDPGGVEKEIEDLCKPKSSGRPFLQFYSINGFDYLQILSWKDHQSPHNTERESKLPPPPIEISPLNNPPKDKDKDKDKCASPKLELSNRAITVKQPLLIEQHEIFWESYPKKKNKGNSEKAWLKLKPSTELQQKITQTVKKLELSEDWTKENGKYIPYPASWLNAKGWEDETTKEESWQEKAKRLARESGV